MDCNRLTLYSLLTHQALWDKATLPQRWTLLKAWSAALLSDPTTFRLAWLHLTPNLTSNFTLIAITIRLTCFLQSVELTILRVEPTLTWRWNMPQIQVLHKQTVPGLLKSVVSYYFQPFLFFSFYFKSLWDNLNLLLVFILQIFVRITLFLLSDVFRSFELYLFDLFYFLTHCDKESVLFAFRLLWNLFFLFCASFQWENIFSLPFLNYDEKNLFC